MEKIKKILSSKDTLVILLCALVFANSIITHKTFTIHEKFIRANKIQSEVNMQTTISLENSQKSIIDELNNQAKNYQDFTAEYIRIDGVLREIADRLDRMNTEIITANYERTTIKANTQEMKKGIHKLLQVYKQIEHAFQTLVFEIGVVKRNQNARKISIDEEFTRKSL